jgi:DNA-binding GntR family transcriptional regulator
MSGGLAKIAAMQLRELIQNSPTQLLPPLPKLGKKLNVSARVAGQAAQMLQAEGLISGSVGTRYKILRSPNLDKMEPAKDAAYLAGEQIMQFVGQAIEKNQIRLPAITTLAKALGHSYLTIRLGLHILEKKGYVQRVGIHWILNKQSEQTKELAGKIRKDRQMPAPGKE